MTIQPAATPIPGARPDQQGAIRRRLHARAAVGGTHLVLRFAIIATAVAAALAIVGGQAALFFDDLQELLAAGGATLSLSLAVRRERRLGRWIMTALALSMALATLGMVAWDVSPAGDTVLPELGDVLFILAVVVGIAAIAPTIFGGLKRGLAAGIATDALILFLAGVALVASTADPDLSDDRTGFFGVVLLVAATAACAFALIGRRIRPTWGGPWTLLTGAAILSSSWMVWAIDPAAPSTVGPSDFMFSGGVLLIAFGGVTWRTRATFSARYERVAPILVTVIPVSAVLASLATATIYLGAAAQNLVAIATAAVIVTAVARQVHLYVREARALEAERQARLNLAAEVRERAATLFSIQRLAPGESIEGTAREICREALALDDIDVAIIRVYGPDGSVVPLAVEGLGSGAAELIGRPLTMAHAARVRARAADGLWERTWEQTSNPYQELLRDLGVRQTVNAALRWNDLIIGDIGLGTCTPQSAASLSDRLATVKEFAVVTSALLGPAVAERDHAEAVRRAISDVIRTRSFHPVFQPIVELASRRIVGYEALTRFEAGQRPDVCFADAWSVGLGSDLELATLTAAVDAAQGLPAGASLSLNISPRLVAHAQRLRPILAVADRPLIVEITEHETIDDYDGLRHAIEGLGTHIRVAVDDAGAGVANLGHIIDLRPDFVKLDISLVRGVNADLGRQAMVVGMRHFSKTAGCRLIAEGVETVEEADTLTSLGVEFGQGYLLGRPEPIDAGMPLVEKAVRPIPM